MATPTLRELLKDPVYKTWFMKPPREEQSPTTPQWFVYSRETPESPWQRRKFTWWKEAYRFVVQHAKENHDMVISSRRRAYKAPLIKRGGATQRWSLSDHPGLRWCPFCRRPTRFRYYKRHHAIPKHMILVPYIPRCEICGVKADFVRSYQ